MRDDDYQSSWDDVLGLVLSSLTSESDDDGDDDDFLKNNAHLPPDFTNNTMYVCAGRSSG